MVIGIEKIFPLLMILYCREHYLFL